MVDPELVTERSGEHREGRHRGHRRRGGEIRRIRGTGGIDGSDVPNSIPRVMLFAVEQDPIDANGARGKGRRRRLESSPDVCTLRTPRGIEEDQADRLGSGRKRRGPFPRSGEENRRVRGERDRTDGNALCPASREEKEGYQKDKSVLRHRPSPPWDHLPGHIKDFFVTAG